MDPRRPEGLKWTPLLWVPSLYLAMGIPFTVINGTASTMFKSLGVPDGQITVALGSVVVMWSLKPLWAAFLDMYRTKKFFVLAMELLIAALFAGVAMSLPLPGYFPIAIALMWVAAFASSTQDICGDGIYLTSLDPRAQSRWIGVQSLFWNLGKVLATGLLVSGMDSFARAQGWPQQKMWMAVWITAAVTMALFALYHVWRLPAGRIEERPASVRQVWHDFLGTAGTFFHKREFWGMIAFVCLFRLGEGLLMTEGKLFLQSSLASGGLGLTAGEVSSIDAVWGTFAAISGGILGGLFMSRIGLSRALPILGLCLNLPHFTFVWLSHYAAAGHGLGYTTVAICVSIEKFGYGFGFIGNPVYMMQQLAPGRSTMTHYAFATALMNLMLVPTTMVSGPLAEWLGYSTYFAVVMFASVPSILGAWWAPFPLKDDSIDAAGRTPDDPTRVSQAERAVQLLSSRASIFAMLNILTILVIDAKILGSLQGHTGSARPQFFLLLGTAALKGYFSYRTFTFAAAAQARATPEVVYLDNARGAKIATWICAGFTVAIIGFTVYLTR